MDAPDLASYIQWLADKKEKLSSEEQYPYQASHTYFNFNYQMNLKLRLKWFYIIHTKSMKKFTQNNTLTSEDHTIFDDGGLDLIPRP